MRMRMSRVAEGECLQSKEQLGLALGFMEGFLGLGEGDEVTGMAVMVDRRWRMLVSSAHVLQREKESCCSAVSCETKAKPKGRAKGKSAGGAQVSKIIYLKSRPRVRTLRSYPIRSSATRLRTVLNTFESLPVG